MITKFDSLFAGHIDMDNVGYGGTPVNDRRFSNDELAIGVRQGSGDGAADGPVGYDTLLDGRAPFPARRL